jgi:hypothetical protein
VQQVLKETQVHKEHKETQEQQVLRVTQEQQEHKET